MDKNDFNSKIKVLEKILKAGFIDEKGILKIQMTDIEKINGGLNSQEIKLLIDLQKAVKNKRIISFFSGEEKK